MYINTKEPRCSNCGQMNSETFQRRAESGRRCLSCGHENTVRAPADRIGDFPYELKELNVEF